MLRKLDFTTRIFLASAALVVAALSVSALATYVRGDAIAKEAAGESLGHSREIQHNSEMLRLQRLKLMSDLVANDTAFVSYVLETAGNNDPFGGGGSQASGSSVKDLLAERQDQVGFDLGIVLDPNGNPVAQVGGAAPIQGSVATDPVVAAVMKSQRVATGYWLRDGRVYQVAAAPLANRDQLAGYLVLALDVDQVEFGQIARVSGSQLAILDTSNGHDVPVAGTLPEASLRTLGATLSGMNVTTDVAFPITLDGEHWLAQADILQPGVLALTLTSLDKALSGYRAILTTLVIAAIVATLMALVLSGLLTRRLTEPLRQLAKAAQAAARGDYRNRLPPTSAGGEIAQVTQAVDSLLGDLREKEEMEKYMTDLAKYQLDDAAEGTAEDTGGSPATPTPNERVFLALGKVTPAGAIPDAVGFDALLHDLEAPVRRQGGRLAATTDRSAILVFASLQSAFIAAGDVLYRAADRKQPLNAALVGAEAPVGRLEWSTGQQASIGIPVQRLEELLRAGQAGSLVADAVIATKARLLLDAKVQALPATGGLRDVARLELPGRSDTITHTDVAGATPRSAPGQAREIPVKLEPGAVLGGRYDIISQLGVGGMGVVYKVRDRQLDQIVALKAVRADGFRDPELLTNLKNEIRLSRQITHRNVVRIYDLTEVAGLPFISMEYVRGMTLRHVLQRRERLPVSAGLRVMRQVCTALQVAHEQGILHRDVKPDNVILEPTGNAKLMDFGIAGRVKLDDDSAREAVILGTPAYAPPEQLRGQAVDERADLYACGVLMYRMFTGKLPFDERSLEKLIAKKSKADYRATKTAAPELPAALDEVIAACLNPDRDQRPRNAEVLLSTLQSIRA